MDHSSQVQRTGAFGSIFMTSTQTHTPDQPIDPTAAFHTLDLRVGRITRAELNDKARKPAYRLWLEFGPEFGPDNGLRTSSAQLVDLYSPDDLIGRLVIAAVNLGERRIAGFKSQVLVLGLPDDHGRVVLLTPQRDVPLGGRVY